MKKTLGLFAICVMVAFGSLTLISAAAIHFRTSTETVHINDLPDYKREMINQMMEELGVELASPYLTITTTIWCGSDNCFCCDFERDFKTRIQSRLDDLWEIERVYFANPLW